MKKCEKGLHFYEDFHRQCPECKLEYIKRWQKNNSDKVNKRTPKWLSKLQNDHIKLFYEAAVKMTKEIGIKFDVDHIIPLQGKNTSGLHVPWNLQVITETENCIKHNKEIKS